MRYATFEATLADLHRVKPKDLKAFRSRLRVLREMGVPGVDRPGKGATVEYTFEDIWEAHLALSLESSGLPPAKVSVVIKATKGGKAASLLEEMRQKEVSKFQDIWANVLLVGFQTDARLTRVLPILGTLRYIFSVLKEDEHDSEGIDLAYNLINLSRLTRNCERALAKQL
jgi:hypothetical protein